MGEGYDLRAGCAEYHRVSRRGMLRAGTLGVLGFSLPDLFRAQQAQASGPGQPRSFGRAKRVIVLWMQGGVSHHDTFDPKPAAPSEVRGEFKPIGTRLPGVQFTEYVPRLAQVADRFALIRSVTHPDPSHDGADYLVLKGFRAQAGFTHPDVGSVLLHERRPEGDLPPYVLVPGNTWSSGRGWNRFQAGYLRASTNPWHMGADPADAGFRVPDIALQPMLTDQRLDRRRSLLGDVDRQIRALDAAATAAVPDPLYYRAFNILTAPQVRRAFDIASESSASRDEYGRTRLGQRCLMARRLVEAGATFVVVDDDSWDHHGTIFPTLKSNDRLPQLDRAFSTLLLDLERRGMLDDTLVVYLTEFGRTPKINEGAGRDHWPGAFSIFFAGAGVRAGQVIGSSDEIGAYPAERPIRPQDVLATLFHLVGVDPDGYVPANLGRPMPITNGGVIIPELV